MDDEGPFDLDLLDDEGPFEVDHQRAHLFKHAHLGLVDVYEVAGPSQEDYRRGLRGR